MKSYNWYILCCAYITEQKRRDTLPGFVHYPDIEEGSSMCYAMISKEPLEATVSIHLHIAESYAFCEGL